MNRYSNIYIYIDIYLHTLTILHTQAHSSSDTRGALGILSVQSPED